MALLAHLHHFVNRDAQYVVDVNCTRSYVLLQGEMHAPDVVRPLEELGFSPAATPRDKYAGEDCRGQVRRT